MTDQQTFNVKMLTKPYIELWNDGSGRFSWRWKIMDGNKEIGQDMAATRWGALWAARRAWRKYRKHPHVQRIPL